MVESLNCLQILKKRCKGFDMYERAVAERLRFFYFTLSIGVS